MSMVFDRSDVRRPGYRSRDLSPPKMAEVIARWLRREIHDQKLEPGDALPREADLQTHFKAGRPAVREALRLLEAQQLVRIGRGATGGARYRLPDLSMVAEHVGVYLEAHRADQRDLTEARLNIEPCVVGFIAGHAAAADLAPLRASVASHRAALPDVSRLARENERFYELLAELCPNKTLSMMLLMLREIIGAQATLLGDALLAQDAQSPAILQAHVEAKAQLVELLMAGDRPGAETLWRKHLQAQLRQIVQTGRGGLPVKSH